MKNFQQGEGEVEKTRRATQLSTSKRRKPRVRTQKLRNVGHQRGARTYWGNVFKILVYKIQAVNNMNSIWGLNFNKIIF